MYLQRNERAELTITKLLRRRSIEEVVTHEEKRDEDEGEQF